MCITLVSEFLISDHKNLQIESLLATHFNDSLALGLTIAQKALTPYSGRLSVQSEVGINSKFIILWPKIKSTSL